jgi:integrase
LTRVALQHCIDGPRKRNAPGSAAQVYRTLRRLVSFAIKRDYITGLDPMRGIDNPRPYRPGPVNAANDAELLALFATLESSAMWPATKLAIELQLLTGVRPGEARLASWDEIDLEKATWTIPAERVKSGRMFIVHLSPAALALLDRARALRGLNATSDQRPATSDGTTSYFRAPPGAISRRWLSRARPRGSPNVSPTVAAKGFGPMISDAPSGRCCRGSGSRRMWPSSA